jgi:hypothetical protein
VPVYRFLFFGQKYPVVEAIVGLYFLIHYGLIVSRQRSSLTCQRIIFFSIIEKTVVENYLVKLYRGPLLDTVCAFVFFDAAPILPFWHTRPA